MAATTETALTRALLEQASINSLSLQLFAELYLACDLDPESKAAELLSQISEKHSLVLKQLEIAVRKMEEATNG